MNDVSEILQWARKNADELPDEYKAEAFRVLLAYKLGLPRNPSLRSGEEESSESISKKSSDLENWQQVIIEQVPSAHKIANSNDRQMQALWAVIELLKRGEPAYASSIRELIRTKLGVTPQNDTNTGRTLRKLTPKYIDRTQDPKGKKYRYSPTRQALEKFEKIEK